MESWKAESNTASNKIHNQFFSAYCCCACLLLQEMAQELIYSRAMQTRAFCSACLQVYIGVYPKSFTDISVLQSSAHIQHTSIQLVTGVTRRPAAKPQIIIFYALLWRSIWIKAICNYINNKKDWKDLPRGRVYEGSFYVYYIIAFPSTHFDVSVSNKLRFHMIASQNQV